MNDQSPKGSSIWPWGIALGVVCYGIAVRVVYLYKAGSLSFNFHIIDLFFIGPYIILALFVPVGWVTKSAKIIWVLAASLPLLLGIPMAQQGGVKCCAPGQMLTGDFAILVMQYWLSVIGAAVVFIGAIISLVRKAREEKRRLGNSDSVITDSLVSPNGDESVEGDYQEKQT